MSDLDLSNPIIRFNPARAAFVASCASNEPTRYYLHGVHMEPHPDGGIAMVATDGHRMAIGHDPAGELSLPHAILATGGKEEKRILSSVKHDSAMVELFSAPSLDGHLAVVRERGVKPGDQADVVKTVGIMRMIDGRFPDWRRAVPWDAVGSETLHGTFNAKLLEVFGKSFGLMRQPPSVRAQNSRESDPTLITRGDLPWFLGVVMPMRAPDQSTNSALALRPPSEDAA